MVKVMSQDENIQEVAKLNLLHELKIQIGEFWMLSQSIMVGLCGWLLEKTGQIINRASIGSYVTKNVLSF